MKFVKYLEEERTSGKVKRAILGSIKDPKKDVIKFANGEILVVPRPPAGVTFTFNPDEHELAMTITDLVDKLGGYKVKPSKKGLTITQKPLKENTKLGKMSLLAKTFKKGDVVKVINKLDDDYGKKGKVVIVGKGKRDKDGWFSGAYVIEFPNGNRGSYNYDELGIK